MVNRVALLASCIGLVTLSAASVSAPENGIERQQSTASDTTKNDGGQQQQSKFLTGGVDQKEFITIPATTSDQEKKALPKLILEIPKLDKLPAVPKFLQAGATLNDKQEVLPSPDNVWYRIPSFLAGHWQCSEKTITSSVNLQTGKGHYEQKAEEFISELHQGFQQDNTGHYWQFDSTPFLGHSIGPNDIAHYSYVQLIQPVACTDNSFVRRSILIKAEVNGAQIVQTSQQCELIQSLTPLEEGVVREDSIARTLDSQGRPVWQSTSTEVFSRTKPYSPINRKDGKDMKEMFRQYLASHGMVNLVPVN